MRRKDLCDDALGCPDTENPGEHGPNCPRLALDSEIQSTINGAIVRRALFFRRAINSGKIAYSSQQMPYEVMLILGVFDDEEAALMEERQRARV